VLINAFIMFGMGGADFDPAGGEVVLCNKIKALGVDIGASPYQCSNTQAIANGLIAAHAKGAKLIIGGDSLGANNTPLVAASVRDQLGIDYIFGFQPSIYGVHYQITPNVIAARCIYNPNGLDTFWLGTYEWELAPGNTRTKLNITTNSDFHPGDDDVAMQNLVIADIIQKVIGVGK
jgi:hypothetical protein